MQYIEATSDEAAEHDLTVFLAGGITGCRDWQSALVALLADLPITVYNPRRSAFDITDPTATEKQIAWEFEQIHKARIVSFWFCSETLCPIVLYELGAALERGARVVVGVDEEYLRKADVVLQARLVRPDVSVHIGWDVFAEALRCELILEAAG